MKTNIYTFTQVQEDYEKFSKLYAEMQALGDKYLGHIEQEELQDGMCVLAAVLEKNITQGE